MNGERTRVPHEEDEMVHLLKGWAESQATLSAETPFFLEVSFVTAAGQHAALRPELVDALVAAAQRVAADPATCSLAWHVFHRLFRASSLDASSFKRWPVSIGSLSDDTGLLYVLALLGGLPDLRALYRAHSLPDWVARDTLHDVQRWADYYRRHHGVWGIEPATLSWLRLHFRGELYGLGRLQFMPARWSVAVRVFRHLTSGVVVALSESGVRYRSDGQRDGAGGVHDPAGAWTATLERTEEWVTGHAITPSGCTQRATWRLAREEWSEILAPGAPVLDIHIPRGVPLDLEACRRSLQEALRFFPSHFPELPFVAFTCDSWLLDAQLEKLLPPSSNLVRFLRQLYLVPVASDGTEALEWVFDGVPADLASAPRDTALRRAVLDHISAGRHLRAGAGFLLLDDVEAWGQDIYRVKDEGWALGERRGPLSSRRSGW